jgi:hypothetical protein
MPAFYYFPGKIEVYRVHIVLRVSAVFPGQNYLNSYYSCLSSLHTFALAIAHTLALVSFWSFAAFPATD